MRVPWDSAHVFYVWYDALVNYITAIGYGEDPDRFAKWWPAAHHLLGKDIIRFHCVWWPAMCLAAGIDPPAHYIVHGWLLVGGEKMSKTRLNQIDPVELAADIGVDALRYHLVRDVVLGSDGDFTYEGLIARYNSDLANNLGNLLARVAAVVASKCGGIGPAPRPAAPGVQAERGCRRGGGWRAGTPGSGSRLTKLSRRPGDSFVPRTPSSRRRSRGSCRPDRPSTPRSATPSRHCGSWQCSCHR